MNDRLASEVTELADLRKFMEEAEAELQAAREEHEQKFLETYPNLIKRAAEWKAKVAEQYELVRSMAVEITRETGESKPHPAVVVKENTVINDYSNEDVVAWWVEHRADYPNLVTPNKTEVNKIARKAVDGFPVTISKELIAAVDKDLTYFCS